MSDREVKHLSRLDDQSIQLLMREVRDLVRSLEGTTTARVRIKTGAVELEIERDRGTLQVGQLDKGGLAVIAPTGLPGTVPIVAPLVGVFYRAASPGTKPFVEVGDGVEPGQTIGIVEAMKVMNEVISDYRGTVAEILAENGEAVQYEQALMLVATSGE
jgi:acetyl-CoA carboxylase biotin carboxyl carrier protein